jgi:predicted nucleic acid-binding protein
MPFTVLYDANVLFGNSQRDLMIRIARSGLVQAKWTDRILDEVIASIQKSRPNVDPEKLARLRALMVAATPDGLVEGYEPLIDGLQIRDPNDRHVLAAAIRCGAQLIVTGDKDFTPEDLAPWNIEPKHPDEFVLDQIDINDRIVWACVQQIADSRKQRPETVEDVLSQLERSGLVRSAAELRSNWASGP